MARWRSSLWTIKLDDVSRDVWFYTDLQCLDPTNPRRFRKILRCQVRQVHNDVLRSFRFNSTMQSITYGFTSRGILPAIQCVE